MPYRHRIPPKRRQRGASLVISLLLLVALTVLGISTIRTTNLQERMAGNARDLNIALQGAEAGLRDGEARIRAQVNRPVATGAIGCLFCQRGTLPVGIADETVFNWNQNAHEFGAPGARDLMLNELPEDPRYVIEELAFVRDSLVVGQDPSEGRDFYQVTARSTGASGRANTVLQSTYTRRY
jgi:type IV pilus assembly protein PilX